MRAFPPSARGPSLVVPLLVLAALCGCSGGGDEWQEALHAFGQQGEAVYSFAYVAAPPEGRRLILSDFLTQSRDAACALPLAEDSDAALDDFWYLRVSLGSAALGSYAVGLGDYLPSPGQAEVRLIHVQGARKSASFRATQGTVEVLEAASDEASFRQGAPLSVSISADFPLHQVHTEECFAYQTETESHETCTCEDESGGRFTCEASSVVESCCVSPDSETTHLKLSLTASTCSNYCVTPNLDQPYCDAL